MNASVRDLIVVASEAAESLTACAVILDDGYPCTAEVVRCTRDKLRAALIALGARVLPLQKEPTHG